MICKIICKILGVAAALADHGNRSAFRGGSFPGQHPDFRDIESHTIRADHAQSAFAGNRFNFLLQPDAFLFTCFLETGTENMDILVARGDTFFQNVRNQRRGNGDDDQIHRLRQRRQVGIRL